MRLLGGETLGLKNKLKQEYKNMNTWIKTPTKNQVIIICSLTGFLFLRLLVNSDFLTSDRYTNKQYLIFGLLTIAGFAISMTSILLYRIKSIHKSN